MSRIRTIKPELLEDERTAKLPHLEWRLFVSCLLLADDYGNFRADPERVRGAALWAFKSADCDKILENLETAGLLQKYVVSGQSYAHVVGWEKHQRVDHPGKPLCPRDVVSLARPSRESRESLLPDLDPDLDPDQDQDSAEPSRSRGSTPVVPLEPSAMTFPCKGKGSAEWSLTFVQQAEWMTLFPGVDVPQELRTALAWCKANPARQKTHGGMNAFLVRWLTRKQDRGGGVVVRQIPAQSSISDLVSAAQGKR